MIIRLSLTGGNFFAAVKSFDVNIVISGNLIVTAKNSIGDATKLFYTTGKSSRLILRTNVVVINSDHGLVIIIIKWING